MEQTLQLDVVLGLVRNLLFLGLTVTFYQEVVLLTKLKYQVQVLLFVETTHDPVRQQITKSILIPETLPNIQNIRPHFSLYLLLLLQIDPRLRQSLVTIVIQLLRQLQMHIVQVYPCRMLVMVNRRHSQRRNWQRVRHSLRKLQELVLQYLTQ